MVFLGKIPKKPLILGMGMELQHLKFVGTLWGRGNPKFRDFLGGKSPKIPKFWGGDGGRNIGDFPTTILDVSRTDILLKLCIENQVCQQKLGRKDTR